MSETMIKSSIYTSETKKKKQEFVENSYNDVTIIIHSVTGYIYATKIGSDNNVSIRDFFNKSPKWKEIEQFWYENYDRELIAFANQVNVNKDGTIKPCYKLLNGYKETRRGYYIHPDLIHFIIDRCNIAYAFKVSKIMNLINEELHLRNITLETKIEEMQDEIRCLKNELKNANTCMKRIKGSIKIDKHYKKSNTYHLFADTKMQYKNSRTVQVIPLYNAYDTLRLMNYYSRYNCTNLVKLINTNIFEASYENLIVFLYQVSENTLNIHIDYDLLINRILSSKRVKCNYKHSLFEIYCSQQFNIPLFKFTLTESVGLYKQDRGCDLFDINNKVTGQCKYFISSALNERYLNKYFEFVDAMSYDDNYLFVNENITFASSLILYDENLDQINDNSSIDRTKDIYIKTTEDNYISVKFVNVDKFELFVTELEDKYDEHVSYEDFIASLTSFTLKHIQLQHERINSYNNQKIIQEKIKKFNERIHDNKDEQFECTIFKEQREYLKKLIEENPSGIEVNDCIKQLMINLILHMMLFVLVINFLIYTNTTQILDFLLLTVKK